MVLIETQGKDHVVAHGAKPSVGGQSQRIVFEQHRDIDCIVHFHCPTKPGAVVDTVPQWMYECGSHECGRNTSNGLPLGGKIRAVMLDKHGPNIVFNKDVDPDEVISFIEANFDLTQSTDQIAR
jgi:hypothetical protein